MALAAQKAGVGPMAAVAGAIADLAVEDMKRLGCEVAVVENGYLPEDEQATGNAPGFTRRFTFSPLSAPISGGCFLTAC